MTTKRRWLWVVLFILAALLGTLTTSLSLFAPRPTVILGGLGFLTLLGGLILFFMRLLREMRINQFQSEFLAAVSHELKTPISTLELTASLLNRPEVSEAQKVKLWASHHAELKRLRNDVEALLETLRWQSGPITIENQRFHLQKWIHNLLPRFEQFLGTPLELSEGQSTPIWVNRDPKQLELVIQNLIENSKKFARGKPKIEIGIQAIENQRWKINVRDHGWGIPENEYKKIFKRFYRAKTFAPYSIAGTGLGLHLAASACKAMKIKIRAEKPESGDGALFVLEGECA